jgi:FtsP/CotA-like multicopper oxidase with cupredoxin domain
MTSHQNRVRHTLLSLAASVAALLTPAAQAAVPGITGTTFNLQAHETTTTQPDGATIYSWGYGCAAKFTPNFLPSTSTAAGVCPAAQIPGPTLIVTQGQTVTVTLTNNLPSAAGNTSIVFPGFVVTSSGGVAGTLAQEATPAAPVTYTFTATKPGTFAYYSGTQSDLQIEMGMFGAIVVVPNTVQAGCTKGLYSLAASAYAHPDTCYDREYLFQFSEVNAEIHQAAEAGKDGAPGSLQIATDPYQPEYFLVNGRSMPDDMDAPYATSYPSQPYNGNPHMHPGDLVLMRIIGQGRMQHPFHFHGNHARVLARDGNLLLSNDSNNKLAGPLLFTTPHRTGPESGSNLHLDRPGLELGRLRPHQ